MLPFATEFPVTAKVDRDNFVGEVSIWLRGIDSSTVLHDGEGESLDSESTLLRSPAGEELRLREIITEGSLKSIGFRHDLPDSEGRLWRTEAVLRHSADDINQSLIRLRTQCIAQRTDARLLTPRKPYLIKAWLKSGWGGKDGLLDVTDKATWLKDDDLGLADACSVTLGSASRFLPVVYVSAADAGGWILSQRAIDKLAYDLGGMAHVVVEPNRMFSFRLRDETDGANAYGGAIGLALPRRGIIRRFYHGWQIRSNGNLMGTIHAMTLNLRSQMPALGWGWTDLQEQALRMQRMQNRNRLSAEEVEDIYSEEIETLKDRIKDLENELNERSLAEINKSSEGNFSADDLTCRLGPEVWPGEISDRLRLAAQTALLSADHTGLDSRSRVMLERFLDQIPPSRALNELREELNRASRRDASALEAILLRHGYHEKSRGKHISFEADDEYEGLATITSSLTPSDHRASRNFQKRIERSFGITKLPK